MAAEVVPEVVGQAARPARHAANRIGAAPHRLQGLVHGGDDLGDLPAFAAVRALRADGVPGCAVASASTEAPQVAAAADLVVEGPEGSVALLAAIAAELGC